MHGVSSARSPSFAPLADSEDEDEDESGLRIVLTPVQLAAILSRDTLSAEQMQSNRLWGSLKLVGGVLEMLGAGVLCVVPEPTGVTKAGCVVFGLHGSDTVAAGIKQVWTGHDTQTLTEKGATQFALVLGADPEIASTIGLAVDLGASAEVGEMSDAARIVEIQSGRIRLIEHEAEEGSRLGGHTITKHVGKTEAYLRERLAREARPDIFSSFTDLHTAEDAATQVMQANTLKIKEWATFKPGKFLELEKDIGTYAGYGVVRGTGKLIHLNKVVVVLKYEAYNGKPYYILTSYLEK
jgi:hypothetical protein